MSAWFRLQSMAARDTVLLTWLRLDYLVNVLGLSPQEAKRKLHQ